MSAGAIILKLRDEARIRGAWAEPERATAEEQAAAARRQTAEEESLRFAPARSRRPPGSTKAGRARSIRTATRSRRNGRPRRSVLRAPNRAFLAYPWTGGRREAPADFM